VNVFDELDSGLGRVAARTPIGWICIVPGQAEIAACISALYIVGPAAEAENKHGDKYWRAHDASFRKKLLGWRSIIVRDISVTTPRVAALGPSRDGGG